MSSLRKFFKRYNAYLLQRSGRNTTVGELYKQKFLSVKMQPVDSNVTLFLDMPDDARRDLRNRLLAIEKVDAEFPDIDLTEDVSADADLDLPNVLDELKAEVKANEVSAFRFEGVLEQRSDDLLLELFRLIDKTEADKPQVYKKNLKQAEMATALFYASEVVIKRKKGSSLSASAKTAVTAAGGTVTVNSNGEEEIRYNQVHCPFAASIIHVKDVDVA